jgi:RNA polymerase sigma-70 factor (ECF subfamily)
MLDDAQLIEDLRDGDVGRSGRALYRVYGPELYGFAARRLGDAGLAEEAVQETFVRAWQHAGRYAAERGSVRTWLYAIVRNVIIDLERRRGRRPPLSSLPAEGGPDELAARSEPIETAMLRYQIGLAVSRLTPEHRQVITLVHFHGLSLAEIAELTGLPLGTVKSRLHYAARALRLALEELGVTP